MELFIALGAILALDVLALEFGFGGPQGRALHHHDQALEAIKRGDVARYREEIARMERDIARDAWRLF